MLFRSGAIAHPGLRRRRRAGLSCPHCGIQWNQFREQGRLGCPRDYEVFRERLRRLIENYHAGAVHVGRRPSGAAPAEEPVESLDALPDEWPESVFASEPETPSSPPVKKDIKKLLESHLASAVREERYEEAARLRDELRALSADADSSSSE